ncbi:hypothetical protein K438DRAFT_1786520 [Mycena galopus ATCC 62051]|nr:hypothetical protein K438DRAFT_1786520 [Mycena galopus ATCC 62051]
MAPQFTTAPTQYVVRPFFAAPCPVTLPIRLTNIIPEQFPLPCILMDVDTSHTPTPPPRPERVPTPPIAHLHLLPLAFVRDIQTVKSLFKDRYPHLTELEQDKQYADFRVGYFRTSIDASLDRLCTQHLRPSVALSYQEKDKLTQVYTKVGHTIHGMMTDTFPWLAEQTPQLSRARIEKSTKKVVNALAGVAPATGKKLKHK